MRWRIKAQQIATFLLVYFIVANFVCYQANEQNSIPIQTLQTAQDNYKHPAGTLSKPYRHIEDIQVICIEVAVILFPIIAWKMVALIHTPSHLTRFLRLRIRPPNFG